MEHYGPTLFLPFPRSSDLFKLFSDRLLGTAAVIVAEHFIVKKYPRSKKWFAIVNFGGAGVAEVTAGLQ